MDECFFCFLLDLLKFCGLAFPQTNQAPIYKKSLLVPIQRLTEISIPPLHLVIHLPPYYLVETVAGAATGASALVWWQAFFAGGWLAASFFFLMSSSSETAWWLRLEPAGPADVKTSNRGLGTISFPCTLPGDVVMGTDGSAGTKAVGAGRITTAEGGDGGTPTYSGTTPVMGTKIPDWTKAAVLP